MGKAVLIANATFKAKQAFDRTCVGFPQAIRRSLALLLRKRAADGAAVAAEAAVIEAAEGDDASFTRSHIAALTDETKAAIREWARLRLSRGSPRSRTTATGARFRPSRRNVPTRKELGVDRPGSGYSWRRRLFRRRSRLS